MVRNLTVVGEQDGSDLNIHDSQLLFLGFRIPAVTSTPYSRFQTKFLLRQAGI